MRGRFREICSGVGVDAGTAAAFRAQWAIEAGASAPLAGRSPSLVVLKTDQAPGDAVAMTAAIYSLHRAHPGRFRTAVESYWPDVFEYNPDVADNRLPGAPEICGAESVCMHYPAIHQSNDRAIHFMQAWCEHLGSALGVPVPLLTNRPRLYFPDPTPPVGDYWVVCSGGKRDFTTKLWGRDRYQEVVDRLAGKVRFVQVGGAKPVIPWSASTARTQEDDHPPLARVEDKVGETTLRQLFDMVRRAQGVLCGVSLLMHVAAASEKPAVVVAGGREPVPWNAYPRQQYLHTVGALPCRDARGRAGGGCWRYRTVPLGDGTVMDRDTCERPTGDPPTPECMAAITPREVADLIMRYNA